MEVFKTTDYEKFDDLNGNRELNQLHLKRLKESLSIKQLIVPIVVNNYMQVIDGQHRLQACKDLGLPVHYIICDGYGLDEVQILNTNTKNWKLVDYLDSYVSMGIEDYVLFKKFLDKYELTISNAMKLLSNNSDNSSGRHAFKKGSFKVENYEESEKVVEKYKMFADYYEGYNRQSFLRAFLNAIQVDGYNHTEMMNKLKFQSMKLVDATTVKQYTMMLEDIYNYRRRGALVRFL